MEYVSGTHLNNTFYQPITTDEDEKFLDSSRAAFPDFSNDPNVVSWDMEADDVLCHHPLTIHGSSANNSLNG
jgi:ectoine hydroxylase-related dioxygenase (phytanoyl-CoA dioxygenase family)